MPADAEEMRALLQHRIALFARAGGLLALTFLVIGNAASLLIDDMRIGIEPNAFHASGAATFIAIWLLARRGRLGAPALFWLDVAAALLPMALYAGMSIALYRHQKERFDLILILIALSVMVLRAVAVPSTPRQTAVVSALGTAPTIAVAYVIGRDVSPARAYLAAGAATAWCGLSVFVTTFASRVIYGLRVKAADARRLGQYVLGEKIGEGGMGTVHRAKHALLRRPTAIKLLPPEKAGRGAITRFEREVQNTSRLTHPNTVAIYDFGRTPEGIFYYAMEYLPGLDLQTLVDSFGPLPASRVVHVLQQICGSLAEAHEARVIHRDIKPANVILCERGGIPDVVKVVDFGLAKDVEADADVELSNVSTIIGTPLYISPEAIVDAASVDERSDLYSLGAVGYFLLTGKPVFSGSSAIEVCGRHLHAAPAPPSRERPGQVPPDLDALVLACLAKKKEERPASARALRSALLACEIEPWTEEQARAWWQKSSNQKRAGDEGPIQFAETVAVDLAARAP